MLVENIKGIWKLIIDKNCSFLSVGKDNYIDCVKRVRIRSCSGPHFPAFGLNTKKGITIMNIVCQ